MANLPYQPFAEQEPGFQPAPSQSLNVPPEATGAGIAQSAGRMGDTLKQVQDQTFSTALKFQEMANETAANTSAQQYSDFVTQNELEFRKLQGVEAQAAFPAFQKTLQDKFDEIALQLKSPMARLAYQRDARSFYMRSMYSAGLHVGDQAKIANDASWKAGIETAISQGALHPDDPESFNTSLANVIDKSLIYAHGLGLPRDAAEQTQQHYVGELTQRTIEAMLATNNVDGAKALFDRMKTETLPDSGIPAMDAAHADQIGQRLRVDGTRIYTEQDKAATAATTARVGLAIKNGGMSIEDGVAELTANVDAGSDRLNITDPNQRAERLSDAASGLGVSVIESIGASGTTIADDRKSLAQQQAMYQKLLGMKLPGHPDQPLLNSHAQDAIAIRLHSEAETIERRSEVEDNRAAAQLRIPLMRSIENGASMIDQGFPATGLPTDAQIRAAYPNNPAEAADKMEAVADMRRVSGFLTSFKSMNLQQMQELKTRVAPSPSRPDTFAQDSRISRALDSAINRTVTALKNDPVQYLVTANGLQDQLTTAEQHPLMFGAYADHMTALQSSMGIPDSMQHVLPAGAATTIAQSISSDPATAGQKMQSLQAQFGAHWPQVWRDLTTLGKLPADYQLIGALDNKQDAELLARAMQEGKNGKNVDDLLPATQAADIKRNVLGNPQLSQYLFSLDASGASDEQKVGIRDGVLKLAYAKAFYSRDPAAAANAVRDVIGQYDFSLSPAARIPSAVAGQVKTSARSFISNLDEIKVDVPSTYGQPGMPGARDYIDAIKATPNWFTNPTGTALWLKDNGNRIVLGRDGHPVAIPFTAVGR